MSKYSEQGVWGSVRSHEGSWQEKRRGIVEILRQRVKFIQEIFLNCEKISLDEDFEAEIEKLWNKAGSLFSPDIIAKVEKYIENDRKIKKGVKESLESFRSMSEEEWEEFEEAGIESIGLEEDSGMEENEVDKLVGEQESMSDSSGQLKFMAHVRYCLDGLVVKHNAIKNLPNRDIASVVNYFYSIRPDYKIDSEKVLRIEEGNYSLSLVIEADEYERVFGNDSVGLHFTGSSLNVIKDRNDKVGLDITIRHENVHNLTDDALVTENPIKRFDYLLTTTKAHIARENDEVGDYVVQRYLRRLSDEKDFLDLLHGEIVAAFEHAEEHDFSISSRGGAAQIAHELSVGKDFLSSALSLRTAGSYMLKLVARIKEERKSIGDEDKKLTNALKSLEKNIKKGFMAIVGRMKTYIHVAEVMGEEVRNDVETLFFILRPTQYRHVEAYLKEVYNSTDFQDIVNTQKLMDKFFTIDDVLDLNRILNGNPKYNNEKFKKIIAKRLEELTGNLLGSSLEIGMNTVGDMREYTRLIKNLISFCGLNSDSASYLPHHIQYAFFSDFIESDVRNDFDGLSDFCKNLNAEEKEDLYEALELYFEGYILDDLDLENFSDLKKRPLWKVIKSMGLAKRLDKLRKIK